MKIKNACFLIAIGLFSFSSCKKEADLQTALASIGSYWSNGKIHKVNDVIQTADDQFLICGNVENGEHGATDGFLMKVNQQLQVLWYKNYGGNKNDFFNTMCTDASGNIMLAGSSFSFAASVDSFTYRENSLFYMVYVDQNGKVISEKTHQPKGNKSNQNYGNTVRSAIDLKNGNFCISGSTLNIKGIGTNQDLNYNAYSFITDTGGNVTKTNFFSGTFTGSSITDAVLNSAGDIVLNFKSDTGELEIDPLTNQPSGFYYFQNLITINKDPAAFSINAWKNKSPNVKVFEYLNEEANSGQLENLSQSKLLWGKANSDLKVVDQSGKVYKKITFKEPFKIANIRQHQDSVIISGFYKKGLKQMLCWAVSDLEGHIYTEAYSDFVVATIDENAYPKIKAVLLNAKHEFIAVGSGTNANNTNFVFLKFDQTGKIIQ